MQRFPESFGLNADEFADLDGCSLAQIDNCTLAFALNLLHVGIGSSAAHCSVRDSAFVPVHAAEWEAVTNCAGPVENCGLHGLLQTACAYDVALAESY